MDTAAPIEGGHSLLWPLRVAYSAAADPSAPAALLLKVPRPDIAAEQTAANGRRECLFYASLGPQTPELPTVRCYDAAITDDGRQWHLLLEDLSATHHESHGYAPPPAPLCTDAVDVLATLHGRWWRDPRLGGEIGQLPDDAALRRQAANARRAIAAFIEFMDGHIPDQRRRTYERLAAVFPDLLRRQRQAPVTLIHGDAHWRNFLYPNDRAADRTRIFDWQSCAAGSAAHDLAYMLPRHWHPEPRRDLLDHLLARYHHTILRCGVTDYAWDQLWEDFRLAAARHMVAPATNWYRWGRSDARPMPPAERAQRLERFLVPFDALRCQELLASL